MKERDPYEFSWTLLLIVTAVSFLAFSGLIKLLGGSSAHTSLFFKIGLISAGVSLITLVSSLSVKLISKNDKNYSSSKNN